MARYNNWFVRDQVAPAPPYTSVVVEVPVQAIPFALGALESRAAQVTWVDAENWRVGRQLIREMQVGLLMGADIGERIDRLYRLIDAAFYGRQYIQTSIDPAPLTISPAIPAVPDSLPVAGSRGLIELIDKLQGEIQPGWFGVGGTKATIADVVRALSTGKESTQEGIWDSVQDILDSGGDAAQIGDAVGEIAAGAAEAVGTGGLLVALLGGILANTAMQSAQIVWLQRIIFSLDGGGLIPPGDNVLRALRGNVNASAERNVIDKQSNNQSLIDKLDELIASSSISDEETRAVLIQIRDTVA